MGRGCKAGVVMSKDKVSEGWGGERYALYVWGRELTQNNELVVY